MNRVYIMGYSAGGDGVYLRRTPNFEDRDPPALADDTCKGSAPLKDRAKLSCAEARKQALAKVGAGVVKDAGLEEEHGKLIYSIDIKKPKTSGIEEVQIDALTGAVVSVEHEDAKAEAAERAADKKEAAQKKQGTK